ncbi:MULTISPECIES: dTDP-4-dehydrorhamnose reductase [Pseudomonas]|jgi:dTDP-4-dehydrorhamnose reductase|uniref:dTDP-4-dehydrorhamnose reductase n=1 Tax=Pseudomonas shirazica TaxID=1940636 RepID=A0ABY9SS31_9PSED|nr:MULTISPECIES: dTDP-4-dehydrorhamnose reductase [Pseudomonas]KXK71594.1 dTDP-4-dehydrorhamnose reductase [Pseudomonas monteilii]MCO7535525.1 dTDP-4-dehydrorhamnose reductase [Pseudomonas asiatica]MCO7549030.1 dTDP-4-dehydrorhamnose reductase [Pseudomonas asiatica]MCO7561423.1 dTDP-4-dehydrorhamnose reductase [Pseudomonas asiatica]WMY86409.1 dTDP-4-dehydrorhamnose reductase [Pseudomonas shirazica]
MKILLLGKNGQVGWELQRSLAPLGEVLALDSRSVDFCGDLGNLEGLKDTLARYAPDVIVNAAAYTAVDKAESEPSQAHLVNAEAVAVMAEAAASSGALLVHYSTDYVFPGDGTQAWRETDGVGPLNVYGVSKLAGEQAIQASGCRHLVFRTCWVYAARGNNFAKTMLRLARERDTLGVIDDQFGAPTGAELIADVTAHAIPAARENPKLDGIYHLAAGGETTWCGYARYVINLAAAAGLELKVSAEAVNALTTDAYPTPAKRPANSRLNTEKLQKAFQLNLPSWEYGVARMLTEIIEKQ